MKQTIKCPICHDAMLNTFICADINLNVKKCYKHPDHYIKTVANSFTEIIYEIQIKINNNPLTWANWNFTYKRLYVFAGDSDADFFAKTPFMTELPWFEPDLNNYKKLVQKIHTYIVFL